MTYHTKLGTIPYANVVTDRKLKAGDRLYLPETQSFKPVTPRFKPRRLEGLASCIVDKVDGDVLFLSRF